MLTFSANPAQIARTFFAEQVIWLFVIPRSYNSFVFRPHDKAVILSEALRSG
jgi:hypothetical protein